LEAAALAADEFRDGVWLVELAPLAEPSSVASAVAATLSIQPQVGVNVVEAITDWLRDRRLLLVLDNCEHLLSPAGAVASTIMTRCPTVTVLATSREPLGVDGERVVPLSGLDTADAADLFCDRASATDDTLAFTADDQAAIVAICEALDGIPLAIELAAARVRSLTPTDVLHRLGDRLQLLRSSGRRGSERHRTLQSTVDWSYQLLTGDERLLFARLSVFAGGFDLAAVEAICTSSPLDRTDVLDVLANLVDKSMIVVDRGTRGSRYRLLETLRQFAAERAAETGAADALRDGHVVHYAQVAEDADGQWATPDQLTADGIFEREWDNLRAAHAWAVETANVAAADRILAATRWHALVRGRVERGDWAERTLELESAGLRPASVTYALAAGAAVNASDNDAGIELAERGIRAAPWPDHPDTARCWWFLVLAHLAAGRGEAALEPAQHLARIEPALSDPIECWEAVQGLVENALANDRDAVPGLVNKLIERARRIGAPTIFSHTARYRALCALYAENPRNPERAFAAAHDGLVLARKVRDLFSESNNLSALSFAAVALRHPDAEGICRDALVRLYDIRHWQVTWLVIETTAGWFAAAGRLDEAAVLYGHLDAYHPPWGLPPVRRARQRGLDRVRQLPEYDLLMAQGADMDRDELVAYTLERLEDAGVPEIEPA
jgi:predicted ATPase